MSKVIDLEGEIPLHSVQVDGLVSYDRMSSFRLALRLVGAALVQLPTLYALPSWSDIFHLLAMFNSMLLKAVEVEPHEL